MDIPFWSRRRVGLFGDGSALESALAQELNVMAGSLIRVAPSEESFAEAYVGCDVAILVDGGSGMDWPSALMALLPQIAQPDGSAIIAFVESPMSDEATTLAKRGLNMFAEAGMAFGRWIRMPWAAVDEEPDRNGPWLDTGDAIAAVFASIEAPRDDRWADDFPEPAFVLSDGAWIAVGAHPDFDRFTQETGWRRFVDAKALHERFHKNSESQ